MLKQTLALLVILTLLLAGCGLPPITALTGSGRPVTQRFDFDNFNRLEIGGPFRAEVVAADDYLVEVTIDDNLVDRLRAEQTEQTVAIGLAPGTVTTNTNLRVRIHMPDLSSLNASGACHVQFSGFSSRESVRIDVSGASTGRGEMDTGALNIDVSGASTLTLSGRGDSLQATVSGASTADLHNFAAGDAEVEATGASRVNVNASGHLDAQASGASTVRYSGNPTLGRIDESGASTVAPR